MRIARQSASFTGYIGGISCILSRRLREYAVYRALCAVCIIGAFDRVDASEQRQHPAIA